MIRSITSLILALAIVGALVAGPCMACTALVKQEGIKHSGKSPCCDPKGKCGRPGPAPLHSGCASPVADLSMVEQASPAAMPVMAISAEAAFGLQSSMNQARISEPAVQANFASDLCLLHSVLNI